MTGYWQVTSHGDTVNGTGKISTEMDGEKMGFEMSWEGKRLGDCQ